MQTKLMGLPTQGSRSHPGHISVSGAQAGPQNKAPPTITLEIGLTRSPKGFPCLSA